jgi:hypothetical protein
VVTSPKSIGWAPVALPLTIPQPLPLSGLKAKKNPSKIATVTKSPKSHHIAILIKIKIIILGY